MNWGGCVWRLGRWGGGEQIRQLVTDPEAQMFMERGSARGQKGAEGTEENRSKNEEAEALRWRQSTRGEEKEGVAAAETVKKRQRARQNRETDFRAAERRLCKQVRVGGWRLVWAGWRGSASSRVGFREELHDRPLVDIAEGCEVHGREESERGSMS